MDYDIAIMGGGFGGLTAGVRAAELGLSAVILERGDGPSYMCNSRVATGAVHAAFLHPGDEPEDVIYDQIMSSTGNTARPDLARTFAANGSRMLDWMREKGCEFVSHPRRAYGLPLMAPAREMGPGLDWENSGPNRYMGLLTDAFTKAGGALRTGAEVTDIQPTDGGYSVSLADGETTATRAVVVADGGFQANREMVGQHLPTDPARIRQRNTQTATGDGIRFAQALGAAVVGMDKFYGHVLSLDAMESERLWPYPQVDVICAKSIVVDGNGKRFADEGKGGIFMTNAIAALDDPLSAVAIFDESVWKDARETDIVPPNPHLEECGGTVHEGTNLDELAEHTGLDSVALTATVDAFNHAIQSNALDALDPPRSAATYSVGEIVAPPFYAIPLCAGITVTSGGLSVDGRAQVRDGSDAPIAGLYAAGSSVGGVEGGPDAGYIGGLIKGLLLGMVAAESAAEDLGA